MTAGGDGLVPVVVQHAETGEVLLLAYGNAASLELTRRTGELHLWSRSRQKLWRKGESSGNVQRVVELAWDCDSDAVLARVVPLGPACHRGTGSCFSAAPPSAAILAELSSLIEVRSRSPPPGSYVAGLLSDRVRLRRKVAEEAIELILASEGGDRVATIGEAADLLFHALVLLRSNGIGIDEVLAELARRRSAAPPRTPSDAAAGPGGGLLAAGPRPDDRAPAPGVPAP